jgi:hypothetical protein
MISIRRTMSVLKFLLFAICLVNAFSADVFGTWAGTMGDSERGAVVYLTIVQRDNAISGTLAYEDESKMVELENPVLNGEELSFEIHDNPNRVVHFRLTISDGSLSGRASSNNRVLQVSLKRRRD